MASGYGLNGGPNRCFPFWQELLACYVVNTSSPPSSSSTNSSTTGGAKTCLPALEDYEECLHHRKERTRTALLQHAMRKDEAARAAYREPPKLDEIRGLGLLGREEGSRALMEGAGRGWVKRKEEGEGEKAQGK